MSVRYIGSKARVVDRILDVVGSPPARGGFFVDAFTGTGAVASAAARAGWSIRINDNLYCATVLAAARVTSWGQVPFDALGGYESAIKSLNNSVGLHGFIWRQYSPASIDEAGLERRYFTEDNAQRIDGMRATIQEWADTGLVTPLEERLLIGDLLVAVNRVANIAGTYGCFLREFASNAHLPIVVVPENLLGHSVVVDMHCRDVYDVPAAPEDVVYYDPPYTKRQYAAYYHILETVARGDEPEVEGITGLRPWRDRASVFCYKAKALGALVDLIASTDANRILLSYSDEGHVALSDLQPQLDLLGTVRVHNLAEIGRYRPNQQAADTRSSVHEFLIEVVKTKETMHTAHQYSSLDAAGAQALELLHA